MPALSLNKNVLPTGKRASSHFWRVVVYYKTKHLFTIELSGGASKWTEIPEQHNANTPARVSKVGKVDS